MKVVDYFELDYEYFSATGIIALKKGTRVVKFILGSNRMFLDSRIIYLDKKVYLEEDSIMVPSRGVDLIIRQLLKKSLSWRYENNNFTAGVAKKPPGLIEEERKGVRSVPKRSYQYDIDAIVIDPGHGGKDPGGIGYNNIKEKDIVLVVAKEVKREMQRRFRGKEIIMTREDDDFVSLQERGEIADRIDPGKNPIFVSIHANASLELSSRGYECYFLSLEPTDEGARDVATKENSVLSFEIEEYNDYLKEIINRIVDVEYRRESMQLAGFVQKGLREVLGDGSVDRGAKGAFFYVLKAAKMPAVLIEIGFVTNKKESLDMLGSDYQKRLVKGIVDGLEEFNALFQKTEGFTR